MKDPIEAAIADGRILESSREEYRRLMSLHPRATTRFLERLAPAVTPPDEQSKDARDARDYPREWLSGPERSGFTQRMRGGSHDGPDRRGTRAAADAAYPREWVAGLIRPNKPGRVIIADD